jgi:hypothetical protein
MADGNCIIVSSNLPPCFLAPWGITAVELTFAIETKWVNPAEADISSGRRDWLGGLDEESGRPGIFRRMKNLVVG